MYVLRRCLFGLIAIVATGLMVASCESVNKLSNLTGPTPDLAPTFSSIQLAVIQSSGSFSGLVNVASRNKPGATLVVPGDPDNSYVIQKLEGATGIVGRQMPFNGPPYLTAGQIQIIRRWILLGAKND